MRIEIKKDETKKSGYGEYAPSNNCFVKGGRTGMRYCSYYRTGFEKTDEPGSGGVNPYFRCALAEIANEPRGGDCSHSTVNPKK